MSELKVSVGPGKPNKQSDVLLVQRLLNASLNGIQKEPLKLDGFFGPDTAADILVFQALVMGLESPNGVVDPGEQTIKMLVRSSRDAKQAGQTATRVGFSTASADSVAANGRPVEVEAFIEMALPTARKVKQAWGVPVAVVLAESGLASGWGKYVKNNAYFGIQAKVLTMGSAHLALPEIVDGKHVGIRKSFRSYADYAESAQAYGRFLSETASYRLAFQHKNDPIKFARTLALLRRSNDPHHAQLLTRTIESYGLDAYDR